MSAQEQIIPWLDKKMQTDRTIKMIQPPIIDEKNPPQPTPQIVEENVLLDFKSFVLNANNRPIDFQIVQMMNAIKMLMDVCEKQQILIDSLGQVAKQNSNH